MKHVKIKAFDCPDAYVQTLSRIHHEGDDFYVGYGSEITNTKKLNITIEIEHPENLPILSSKAPCDIKYVQGYALEYLWCPEKQDDEIYTYGYRLQNPVDQISEVKKRVVNEPRDRQLTMVLRRPDDIYKNLEGRKHEPPCLSLIDCEVLDGKFHLTSYFRSWDAYAGLPANIAGIQIFNESFVKDINNLGYELKGNEWEELQTGKLIFHSKNCHIYERNAKLVEDLLGLSRNKETKTHMQKVEEMKSSSDSNSNAHGN